MDDDRLVELLKKHADCLSQLLADPHPGLPVWWDAVHDPWGAIARLWNDSNQADETALFEVTHRDTHETRRIRARSGEGAIKICNWPPAACSAQRIGLQEGETHGES
ncbi:MAG: hypothetical protein WC551_09730 [Patescibacteria group bacterium]